MSESSTSVLDMPVRDTFGGAMHPCECSRCECEYDSECYFSCWCCIEGNEDYGTRACWSEQ